MENLKWSRDSSGRKIGLVSNGVGERNKNIKRASRH